MENFTPLAATIGGALIGLSAVLLMLFNGRIAGISGIFSGTLAGQTSRQIWRYLFLLGLVIAPLPYWALTQTKPAFEMTGNWAIIVGGGLLVGFGTRLGSGCTSGHGVCGLPRLAPRSVVSVLLFMVAGVVSATATRLVVGG